MKTTNMFQFVWICTYLVLLTYYSHAISPIVVNEQILWETGLGEISAYRTPILINTQGGLLALCGARKFSSSDTGAKVITLRRSLDHGMTWKPTVFIVDDFKAKNGLNIGMVVVDRTINVTIMTFCFCVHNLCSDHKPMNYIMRSHDWGYTWSDPEDLSVKNPYFKDWPYCFGPGYGIQKQYKPHVGRLISCGHTVDRDNFKTQSMYCLYSDDHGITWTVGATLYGMPYGMGKKNGDFLAGEPQLVELPDGSIFVNIRNTHGYHCNCRIIAKSFDGGETFPLTNVTVDPNLVDPGCEGSLLLHKNIMFFSNPNSSAGRLNMTVKYSMDYGKHWNGDIHIYSDISEYSCLADIDENHVGVLYERDHYQQMGFAKIRLN